MASGRITLSYTTTSNGDTSAIIRVTMTYYGNGETWNSSPSSNNCYITLNGTTKYFTHAYTTSTSAQTMGYADFTITKTHSTQSLTATGGITNYSTYYSNPTGSCAVSVSAKTSYAISYNANGGSGAPSNQTKWYNETLTLSTSQPTRTGYIFAGWWTTASGGTRYGTTYTANAAVVLYAHWTAHTRTFKFHGNGNTGGSMSDQSISYASSGTTNLNTNTFTKTNNEFVKWNTNSAGTGTDYNNQASIARNTITSTSTVDLYAQWKVSYIASTISDISAVRCNSASDGTSNDEGNYGKLTFKVSKYSNGSSQSYPTVSAKYDTNTAITLTYTEKNNIRTYTSNPHFSLSGDNQHDIVITKTDGDYGTKTFSTYISAKFFTIDITADGKGIGLLTTAPNKGIALGDYITTDVTLYKSSGDSPSLIFQRGTLTDNYNDWRIYDKQGWLYFGQRGSGSTEWPTSQEWSINTSGLFSGTINWSNVNNKPDYITNQGTVTETTNGSGLWRYRKWNSGFQEVWYQGSIKFTSTSSAVNSWQRAVQNIPIPLSSMTNVSAFNDNAVVTVSGAYTGRVFTTGGIKESGTQFEAQQLGNAAMAAETIGGWNIYISGAPR